MRNKAIEERETAMQEASLAVEKMKVRRNAASFHWPSDHVKRLFQSEHPYTKGNPEYNALGQEICYCRSDLNADEKSYHALYHSPG